MQLIAVGVNHRTAPVELREALDFRRDGIDTALASLSRCDLVREAVVLSTCNRVELYAAVENDTVAGACARFIAEYHGVAWESLAPHVFTLKGIDAARHLFRVASGLESLVVGEPQILGQVKEAFAMSERAKRTGALTSRAFASAFTAGKRVRSETGLGEGAVSISYAATALARKIFGDFAGREVLVLGAGEMAELTGTHLRAHKPRAITVANRTLAAAQALAQKLDGTARAWDTVPDALKTADIIVSATGASMPVLTAPAIAEAMRVRRGRPLFIIDIAVPRDVEADAGRLEHVFLYNIDDLRGIVCENMSRRETELAAAARIVDEEVEKFTAWLRSRRAVPTIVALRERFESIRQSELRRLDARLAPLTPEARARIDEITHLLVEKLLLTPTEQLKAIDDETTLRGCAEAVTRLFAPAAQAVDDARPVRFAARQGRAS